MKGLRVLAAAAVVCLSSSPAFAFKKCKMPDGRMVFADVPPPGCVVQGEFVNPPGGPADEPSEGGGGEPAASSSDAGDARAIAERRRIERDLNSAADDLQQLKDEAANAPKRAPGIYVYTDGSGGEVRSEEFTDPGVAAQLKEREETILKRIANLREEFAGLSRDVASRHGGSTPSWWSEPRCRRCP